MDMRPRQYDTKLYELAEPQLGYFTTDQASEAGILPIRLLQLVKSEDIERVSRGVYRLTKFPVSALGQYMEATLWPQVRRPGVRGVLSHESALSLYELSDASPSKVHITLPPTIRIRRAIPAYLSIHHAHLAPADLKVVEGIRVTTPERTIRDVQANHIGPALVRQAIADGRRTGHLTFTQADRLERELLDEQSEEPRARGAATTADQ
jgi:predicted transcriptional regulator of viral defense system